MTSTDRKARSRAEQKSRRPAEILDAAFEEFVEKGYVATRVEDVAARIGVTKGTIYLYFPTKEILFEEAMRHISAALTTMRTQIDGLTGSCTERLIGLLRLGHATMAGDRRVRELIRLCLSEGMRFPGMVDRHHDEFVEPLTRAMRELVQEGVASGEFAGSAVTAEPEVLVSPMLHLVISRLMYDTRLPLDEATFIEAHLALVLRALRTA